MLEGQLTKANKREKNAIKTEFSGPDVLDAAFRDLERVFEK
jgi:hypothetical protein